MVLIKDIYVIFKILFSNKKGLYNVCVNNSQNSGFFIWKNYTKKSKNCQDQVIYQTLSIFAVYDSKVYMNLFLLFICGYFRKIPGSKAYRYIFTGHYDFKWEFLSGYSIWCTTWSYLKRKQKYLISSI